MHSLKKESDLRWKHFVGYSPERINPGDPDHNNKIVKVISETTTVKKLLITMD